MANTSDYLRKLSQNALLQIKNHPIIPFYIALLASVPLSHGLGNVALMLFAAASLFWFNKHRFVRKEIALILPVLLFVLMAMSLAWSVNFERSASSLSKEIPLLAIPVCSMLFPAFSRNQKRTILEKYAYAMAIYGVFYIVHATFRYAASGDTNVFFYHELVTKEVNAIHVSIYVAVAFFALLAKSAKNRLDWFCMGLLAILLAMLSSKNIIVVFVLLLLVYGLFFSGLSAAKRTGLIVALLLITIVPVLLISRISDRFRQEYETVFTQGSVNQEMSTATGKVFNVSAVQAWNQEKFNPNDYFPGTAFRVYQVRIFCEMLREDGLFLTGYGLNATNLKIREKAEQHGLWLGDGKEAGYQTKNFHNQYVQNFADLGIFGLLLLLAMLILNLKKGVDSKDFVHISFAVLMISLFLTESFLWRQRGVMFFASMYCLFNMGPTALAVSKK